MDRTRGTIPRRRFLTRLTAVSATLLLDPTAMLAPMRSRPQPAPPPEARLAIDATPSLHHFAWVWQFRHDGARDEIRDVLAAHNLGIVLKTHDGTDWMSTYDPTPDAVTGPDRVREFAEFFEAGGVPFHAWCVVKGLEPKAEAQIASDVLSAGARSLFLDLESHPGFWRGTAESAAAFGKELRRLQPGAWLSTTIDARPWEIDRIPLTEFAAFTDEIAPQVYWSAFANAANIAKYSQAGEDPPEEGVTPQFVLDAAMRKLRPFNLPVHPLGDGTVAGGDEWSQFLEQAFAHEAEAVSVWRFGVTDPSVWRLLKDNPPRPLTYVVQAGDTLGALAGQWNTDVRTIAELNGISNVNLLSIGQELRVPRGARDVRGSRLVVTYTVQPGDTLAKLARQWDTDVQTIAELNGIKNPNLLSIGQELRVPGGVTAAPSTPSTPSVAVYTVQAGDNLLTLARRWGTTVDEIARLNGISNPNLVRIGQELRIP